MPYANYEDRLARSRAYYKENPKGYKDRAAQRRREQSERVKEIKGQGCTDCGIVLPVEVMQLDHVRGEKLFNVSRGIGKGGKVFEEELAKCEVRCPNCHALRHYHERQGQ